MRFQLSLPGDYTQNPAAGVMIPAMRGRKRKPVDRQIAFGDPRAHGKHKLEQQRARVPRPTGTLPPCPEHLQGRAREAWEFWSAELVRMNLDASCDAMMLEGACVSYARAVEADLVISNERAVIYEPVFVRGKVHPTIKRERKHPAVAIANAAWSLVRGFCSEFGLSPASRVALNVVAPADSYADIKALLSGPSLTGEEKKKLQ
jgi:P27 family predicted phage terminase small subunit